MPHTSICSSTFCQCKSIAEISLLSRFFQLLWPFPFPTLFRITVPDFRNHHHRYHRCYLLLIFSASGVDRFHDRSLSLLLSFSLVFRFFIWCDLSSVASAPTPILIATTPSLNVQRENCEFLRLLLLHPAGLLFRNGSLIISPPSTARLQTGPCASVLPATLRRSPLHPPAFPLPVSSSIGPSCRIPPSRSPPSSISILRY